MNPLVEHCRRSAAESYRATRTNPLVEQQINTGTIVTKSDDESTRYRPRVLFQNPMQISERWGHAVGRIARILQGSGGATALTSSTRNADYPKLAARFLETFAFYMLRGKTAPTRGADHNKYRHLSDRDAARLFMREVEDICDASTGSTMGAWHVPK